MAGFQNLLGGLRRAESALIAQLAGVRAAISSLAGGGASTGGARRGRPPGSKNKKGKPGRPKGRKMSAEARAKIAAAQKARWAKHRAAADKRK
jgi:hypothetical protein